MGEGQGCELLWQERSDGLTAPDTTHRNHIEQPSSRLILPAISRTYESPKTEQIYNPEPAGRTVLFGRYESKKKAHSATVIYDMLERIMGQCDRSKCRKMLKKKIGTICKER